MSNCQHGQKISIFCATQCCQWKDAGGCQICIKKYHNHMGHTIFLKQNDINQLVKKYLVDHNTKPKCRTLQQAIYNYFNRIKTQLMNGLDSLCKSIINQIGYPYLFQYGHLPAYKRLKNKQYKKLIQKDFRILYQSTIRLNQIQFQKQQSRIYYSQLQKTTLIINQLDNIFKQFQKITQKTYANYQHDSSMLLKIKQITKNILQNKSKQFQIIPIQTQQSTTNKSDNKTNKTTKDNSNSNTNNNKLQVKQIKDDRKVSLDRTFKKSKLQKEINKNKQKKQKSKSKSKQKNKKQKSKQKIKRQQQKDNKNMYTHTPSYSNRQDQINQKKQKLIDLMKQKQNNIIKNQQKMEQLNLLTPQTQLKDRQKSKQKVYSKQLVTTDRRLRRQTQVSMSNNSMQEKSSNNSNSFDGKSTEKKDNPDFAHANIPRQQSYKKIFDDRQEVVKRTIVVPVQTPKVQSADQCQSPILKKKKTMRQHPSSRQESLQSSPMKGSNKSGSPGPKQTMKQNQGKSLALLVKSIGMKAQQAIPHLQTALRYADNNLSAAQYLSYLLLQIGRPKQCLNLCNKILFKLQNSNEYDQLSLNINNNKTAALNMLGRYSQSIVILQKCLAFKQKDTLYKNLGDAYFSIGIYQKAIYNYQKAIQIFDQYDQAYYNLAVCFYVQQNYYNAKIAITKALDISTKNHIYLQLQKHVNQRIQTL